MKRVFLFMLLAMLSLSNFAQRRTDRLDRGLVATVAMSGSGNFISWRILPEEYFDVTYNLYCNGKLLKGDLSVSSYVHAAGSATSQYQVAPVVRGVEGEKCAVVKRWTGISNLTNGVGDNPHTGYLDINCQPAVDRAGQTCTAQYEFNDCVAADVDGDGQVELICKRNYTGGVNDAANKTRFHRIEIMKLDGTRLWWIDLGPNMMAGPDEQWDAVAFDWDMDGKAEVLLRGADNMIIHTATGADIKVGNMNYYAPRDQYTCVGNEYLLYLNGESGVPYASWNESLNTFTPPAYPLKRYENGEQQSLAVWGKDGDGGHRSTKHYFGAPYLDGQHPSIFLGRGCYTRHKFVALDVNPSTHELTQRWYWSNNQGWGSPWFGNGYHNFGIQDVDMDGRDEIVFGSMIIDDNGKGLSTSGLGHGDAQHCSDLDPYRWGLEFFACNEDEPAMNYRNATTSQMYYRMQSTGDDGRALAGNFTNRYPGCVGQSSQTGVLSLTADKVITGQGGYALNFRIYWDGDLCSEILDSPGTAKAAKIEKLDGGRIFNSEGHLNNDSKNNACLTGDILGDWREELLVANGTGMRLYTTSRPTTFRIPSLWYDHGYRNGMVWETIGYNQPPHTSYFLGELEGITVAPPCLTTAGRELIPAGGSIGADMNGKQVLVFQNADNDVTIADGAQPWVAIFNVPGWVSGNNPSETSSNVAPTFTYYTCTVKGGGLSGTARLVKQGEGELILPSVAMTHTGNTDVWNGTLTFDGSMQQSSLWLNRHTALNSNGGTFRRIRADYNATIRPGGANRRGNITTDSLMLGFGSRLQLDIYADGLQADCIKTTLLNIETKLTGTWATYGPKYLQPVFEIVNHGNDIAEGEYLILDGVETLKGKLADIVIEGLGTSKKSTLRQDGDKVYLVISGMRSASDVVWTGAESADWQFGGDDNFVLTAQPEGEAQCFVSGDIVRFDNSSTKLSVNVKGNIEADSIIVDATKNYTFKGNGAFIGGTTLVKRGTGNLTIQTDNTYTGGTRISGGKVTITSLSNENVAYGNLGAVTSSSAKFIIENAAELVTSGVITQGSPMQMVGEEGGVINNDGDFVVNKAISGTVLTKTGRGWMKMNVPSTLQRFVVAAGTVQCINANKVANILEFQGGTYLENTGSNFTIYVAKGKTGTWNTANRTSYTNKITGDGTLTIYCEEEKGTSWFATRTELGMDFRNFEGTINAVGRSDDSGPRWTLNTSSGMPKGTLNIAAGLEVQNTGKTFAIGKLAGTGKLGGYASFSNNGGSGSNTWQVGNDDDWAWGGIVTANSSFVKVGSGKVTLSGKSDHTGTTNVKAGELSIKAGATLGTGTLTVSAGAVFSGTTNATTLSNATVNVNKGGTILVGTSATATTGVMNFGGKNVNFISGSQLQLGIARAATSTATGGSSIQNINRLTMNATIQLHYSSGIADNLAVGDSVVLWRNVTTVTGTPKLGNYVIDAAKGLYWDDTDIAKGILRVTDAVPVAIRSLRGEDKKADAYTLDGRRVSTPRRGQVYVIGGRKVLLR
ncbi:MAG: autotransporter-associated beta strand repeat-containing protein [Bacteroidaceae bacterium]|nr:autotransporter-associated beta strand repeat-containing protein [Bacteroidaceae bacterium]